MKKIFLLALTVLITGALFAQTRVTGKVSSAEDGSPVAFASIVVKGTTNLATSNYINEVVITSYKSAVYNRLNFVC